jgi:hypothetical protein
MEPASDNMTRGYHVRPASTDDCKALAPRLRAPDLAEMRALFGEEDPVNVLVAGCANSAPCYAVTGETGDVLAIFGVVPSPEHQDVGAVWLLGAPGLVQRRITFLRGSRSWLKVLQRRYRVLGNVVDQRNHVHLAWLRWMGFEISDRAEYLGIESRPFFRFRLTRDSAPAAEFGGCAVVPPPPGPASVLNRTAAI